MVSHPSVERAMAVITQKLSETTSHNDDEGMDRMSELPENIIHHIMEFLPRYGGDTTRISVLSKKFFSFWCSFPAIDFNFDFMPTETAKTKTTEYVSKYVRYCLRHRRLNNNTPLKRLTFIAPLHGGLDPDPDGNNSVVDLVNFAIKNQVKELNLYDAYNNIPRKILGYLDHHRIQFIKLSCFPEPVFSAKSITILRLHGFSLDNSSDHQHVTFDFPLIEVLNLRNCSGIATIMLREAKQLKEVDLDFCYGLDKIHIDGPMTLKVLGYGGKHYCEIDIASSCKRVKFLRLRGTEITDDKWVKSNFSGIVEELKFASCSLPVKTRWYLESLKVLELVHSDCKVEFETPKLERFNYHSGTLRWDIPFVISSNRSFEAKLGCFYHGLSSAYNTKPYDHVIEGFSKSIRCCVTDCQILTLVCCSTEELVFSRATRATLHPPLHGVKHLKVELSKLHDMVELIESLLWFASHPNTISIINVLDCQAVKTIEFNYNEYVCCGYVRHGKCYWKHYLKGIALSKFEDMEERISLQAYFSTTYKIWPVSEHA